LEVLVAPASLKAVTGEVFWVIQRTKSVIAGMTAPGASSISQ
jgi:hypothetical protein